MADAWLGISSTELDSRCGYTAYDIPDALDGIDPAKWRHWADEDHWFILDLGQTYTIKKLRARAFSNDDPIDVDAYVSDSKVAWGTAVSTGISTWQDTYAWVEVDTTDKDGRYIKIIINDTEDASRNLEWSGQEWPDYRPIFDAYGDVAGGAALTHTALDTMTISDSIATASVMKHAAADTMNISDAGGVATKSVMKFAKSDTMTIADAIGTKSVMKHATADTMAIVDALVASVGIHVSLSDTMVIADSIEAKLTTEEIAKLKALVRKIGLPTPQNIGVGL